MQHLNGATNFIVATNHGVELAHAGTLGQIEGVFFEGFALAFAFSTVHGLATTHSVDGRFHGFAGQAILFGNFGGLRFAVGQCQQEQLAGDELVTALDGFFLGGLHQLGQILANADLVVALHLRQLLDGIFRRRAHRCHIGTGALQQRLGAIVLAQHGRQQVQGVDVRVVIAQRQALSIGQGFLEFGGELVDTHESFPSTSNL